LTKLLTTPGDTLTEGFGPDLATPTLLVTMTLHIAGIAFHVTDGVQRVDELCKTFTDRGQAIVFYRHVRDAAMSGKRIHQIVWEVQALQEAQQAATGRTPDEIAEAINAEVDAHHAEVTAAHNQAVATVAEVMAGTTQTGGWYGARKAAQQTVTPIGRKVRNTRTRVYLKPLTGPQAAAINQHHKGIVRPGRGITRPMLAALEDKGYGTCVRGVGGARPHEIVYLRLNQAGLAAAQQTGVAA
jgi:hypothetical protein